jgi:hypothetical protein
VISFVVPVYRRWAYVPLFILRNGFIAGPQFEIVFVIDDPVGVREALASLRYAFDATPCAVRVLAFRQEHEWRPPSRAINAGVWNASGEVIAVASPETVIVPPWPEQEKFDSLARSCAGRCFHTGIIKLASEYELADLKRGPALHESLLARDKGRRGTAGLLVVERAAFIRAGGWHAGWQTYGEDDHEIRVRLQSLGLKMRTEPFIVALNAWFQSAPRRPARLSELHVPERPQYNPTEGYDIVYDSRHA